MQGHSLHSGLNQETDFDQDWLTWQENSQANLIKRCENQTIRIAISDNQRLASP
jgi:hypothetical protein